MEGSHYGQLEIGTRLCVWGRGEKTFDLGIESNTFRAEKCRLRNVCVLVRDGKSRFVQ
jgi:hypothetical protein